MYPLINSIYVYLFPWLFSFFVRVSLSHGTLLLCLDFPKVPFTEGIRVEENFTGDFNSMADAKSTARGAQNPQLNVNDKSSFIHTCHGYFPILYPFLPSLPPSLLSLFSCFLSFPWLQSFPFISLSTFLLLHSRIPLQLWCKVFYWSLHFTLAHFYLSPNIPIKGSSNIRESVPPEWNPININYCGFAPSYLSFHCLHLLPSSLLCFK